MKRLLSAVWLLSLLGFIGEPSPAAPAAPSSDTQLLQAFESALQTKDKAALMALYHWDGVPAWAKDETGADIDDWLTRELKDATLAPLPTNFASAGEHGNLRFHLNVEPAGLINFGFTDAFGTEVVYGKVGDTYCLGGEIVEETPAPAGATNDLIIHVQTPDGQPLSHAFINSSRANQVPWLHFRRIYGGDYLSDDQGQIRVPSTNADCILVAANAHSFGWLPATSVTNHAVMVMQPWGRIEGQLRNRNQVLTNVEVELTRDRNFYSGAVTPPVVLMGDSTTTDENGRFVFEFVPPMKLIINRHSQQTPFGIYVCSVSVAPGETNHLDINGHERTVTGHVVFGPGVDTNLDLSSCSPTLRTLAKGTNANPADVSFRLAADGTFNTGLVDPGDYKLSGDVWTNGTKLAYLDPVVVHVTDDPANAVNTPLDIGAVTLKAATNLKVGDTAPDFSVTDLDGKSLNLSDYRGKYVLLDFWATWCGPCVAETPNLKATYEAFGKDTRFAMLSLSLDKDATAPRVFAQRRDIAWRQVFLDEGVKDKVLASYGVNFIPSIFLIGPDGKIIALQLRGTNILATVGTSLPH
jgi:peroxiredoxin